MRRRKPKLLITIMVAVTALVAAFAAQTAFADPEDRGNGNGNGNGNAEQLTAEEIVAEMQPGWNLGNTLDSTGDDETSWGNPMVTEEQLEAIRAEGFKSIRIPVTWSQHQGEGPDYTIDADYLARVQEVVDWALEDGFYVMINIHHDSWQWINTMPTQHDEVLARYNATWTQLAETFADAPPELVFESVNEPQFDDVEDAESHELLHELNTSFHEIVRASGGNNDSRVLILPTLHTSAEQVHLDPLLETIQGLDDPNIAATVHYYGYWPFSVNIAGYTTFNEEVQQDIIDYFDRTRATFVDNGIPVILGEWGLLGFDKNTGTIEQGEKLKFFEYLGYYANESQITTMWWDNGQHFDRETFEWQDPDLFAHVATAWTERSGTGSTDQVFLRTGETPAAQTVTLNPNGQAFEGLYNGDTALAEGTDYTISGDELTLSAELLASLAGDGSLGEQAVLEARFSGGVPWKLHVINFDTPTVADASGTTAELAIPTEFNGDQLATMEAAYEDGTAAGPQNWTTYKEYDVAFLPDEEAGQVVLPEAFFAEVNDNSTVNLTFHFWSGETVSYTLTRSGSTVTGSAG
nr:cellulase family glycosylhydrolase [Glycomyces buryatensis]